MAKITKDELLKIAQLSYIKLPEQEIMSLVDDIDSVLTYAARVCEIAADVEEPSTKNVNVFRDDESRPCDAQQILAQAPEREQDYFVVPMILENE